MENLKKEQRKTNDEMLKISQKIEKVNQDFVNKIETSMSESLKEVKTKVFGELIIFRMIWPFNLLFLSFMLNYEII